MNVDVNQLFEMLESDDEDVQYKGIDEAAKVKYLSIFILPIESKGLWENCARVLANRTNEELELYLPWLFEWLKDANWPGFDIIYKRIQSMPTRFIALEYQCAVKKALQCMDEMWLEWMSGLISNQELLSSLPPDQQKLMKNYYERQWNTQME